MRQLQEDINKMKGAKAAVLRRMEQREKEFREWRAARERELAHLRRSAQRQNAALQQHEAMHLKHQVRGRAAEGGEVAADGRRAWARAAASSRRDCSCRRERAAAPGRGIPADWGMSTERHPANEGDTIHAPTLRPRGPPRRRPC